MSDTKGSKIKFDYEETEHNAGNEIFCAINDQNNRNIISGETKNFFLGDNIRREYDLQKSILDGRDGIIKDLIAKLKSNHGISAASSPLLGFIKSTKDEVPEKDLWLALFDAETEEELEALEQTEVDIMTQAVSAYRSVSATPEFRALEKIRETTRHNEAQALYNADYQAKLTMARNLLNLGISPSIISQSSGLTIEEIERIER